MKQRVFPISKNSTAKIFDEWFIGRFNYDYSK